MMRHVRHLAQKFALLAHFQGDIAALASMRPVWVVDSPDNGAAIDAVLADGSERNLFEVTPDGFVAIQDTSARDRLIGRA
jgi:hypothetical protein